MKSGYMKSGHMKSDYMKSGDMSPACVPASLVNGGKPCASY